MEFLPPLEGSGPAFRSLAVVVAAMMGGWVGVLGRGDGRATLPLIHFAAGAFLSISLLQLLPEAAEQTTWSVALLGAGFGLLVTAWLARWAGTPCPGCTAGRAVETHLRLGPPMLVVLAVHSTLDGLAMIDAGQAGAPGWVTFIALLAHKWPEGLAITVLALEAGHAPRAALGLTFLIENCTFAGLLVGAGLGIRASPFFGTGLAVVAGSFLFLVFATLRDSSKTSHPALNRCASAVGALLIGVLHFSLR